MTPTLPEQTDALVIGAGPAGLMAAEVLAATGRRVLVVDQKPSVARKFLMAGRSGLNLTKAEAPDAFAQAYGAAADWLTPMLRVFGPPQVQAWAEDLGQPLFTGSTGRVFPTAMKASPLLRAWLARLAAAGVEIRSGWRFDGFDRALARFTATGATQHIMADVTVLAMGGASWARLGSDGQWAQPLAREGIAVAPFAPSNVGLRVAWSDHMTRHFGQPVKGTALRAAGQVHRGEFIVSAKGLEGGGIYTLSPAIRAGAPVAIDLLPDLDVDAVAARLARPRGSQSLTNHMRRVLKLPPVALALAREWAGPLPAAPEALARALKTVPVRHAGPRPMDEAISTAGGVQRAALTDGLMLKARAGVFCAGEMLDWDAPTGGYLLTGCFATGRWAGLAAAEWLTGDTVAGTIAPRLH
jgi:hypothetical protein